jgi:hypothetical protein
MTSQPGGCVVNEKDCKKGSVVNRKGCAVSERGCV